MTFLYVLGNIPSCCKLLGSFIGVNSSLSGASNQNQKQCNILGNSVGLSSNYSLSTKHPENHTLNI